MVLSLNVGVLGHVDSGKTSLVKLLSQVASTAAFDKNPQSQERGITIDLGFSSFHIETPEHLQNDTDEEYVQYTLVDCPGHASLIRTIIGGAQIIDIMLLIIDITKGMQTQTAECLVIGEITCPKMIVVLNKIDILEDKSRTAVVEKMKRKIWNTLKNTKFGDSDVPIVATSAISNQGISDLIETMANFTTIPYRHNDEDFLFAVDHCFGIKGQGTVLTGTVLQGQININDVVDIPMLNTNKKIKSMQMFRKPVSTAKQGDRLGICVAQFDPKLMERGIVCLSGVANFTTCVIITINRVKYFRYPIKSKSKFHVTIGYETVMASILLFKSNNETFNFSNEYSYENDLPETIDSSDHYFALLEFEKPVLVVRNSKLIGLKLDLDMNTPNCRIAFYGDMLSYCDCKTNLQDFKDKLKVFKTKRKIGTIDRVVTDNTIIIKNMFKKQTDLNCFLLLEVRLSTGEMGKIECSFGQNGKVKVGLKDMLFPNTMLLLNDKKNVEVILEFKKFVFDKLKKIYQ